MHVYSCGQKFTYSHKYECHGNIWPFNDFFELLFFLGQMIVQHTS